MNFAKKKAVVFGAGGGGKNFIINCKDHFEFIAFSDNDANKAGTKIEGLPVIKPEEILATNFEVIVIASMWVKEISEQLIQLGINKDSIHFPPKNQLKHGTPFIDKATKEFGRELIFFISELLENNKIDVYVDFGALLGFAREGDILDWDDDIDLSVNDYDFEKVVKIFKGMNNSMPMDESISWKCSLVYDTDGNNYGLSIDCIPNNDSKINTFDLYIRCRKRKDGFSIPMGAIGNLHIPEKHFNGYDEIFYKDKKLKAPKNHQEYLTLVYGDWRTPKKEIGFTFYKSVDMKPFGKKDDSPLQYKRLF